MTERNIQNSKTAALVFRIGLSTSLLVGYVHFYLCAAEILRPS